MCGLEARISDTLGGLFALTLLGAALAPAQVTSVSPTELNFGYVNGDPAPVPRTLNVTFTRSWAASVTQGSSWLFVSPSSGSRTDDVGTRTDVVTVSLKPPSAPGAYLGNIRFIPGGTFDGPPPEVNVPVRLQVTAPVSLNRSALNVVHQIGASAPAPTVVAVTFVRDWTATVSPSAPWLSVTPLSGRRTDDVGAETQNVTMSIVPPGSAGIYNTTVRFSAGSTVMAELPVRLEVTAPSQIPAEITTTFTLSTTEPLRRLAGRINLGTVTGPQLNYTATAQIFHRFSSRFPSFLRLAVVPRGSPDPEVVPLGTIAVNGRTPSDLLVIADLTGLAPNVVYNGRIDIVNSDGTRSSVAFSMAVQGVNSLVITTEPQPLALRVPGAPSSGRFVVRNTDNQPALSFEAESSVPWIRLNPAQGQTSSTVQLAIDLTWLSPGVHSGTVTFYDYASATPGSGINPLTYNIVLQYVGVAPSLVIDPASVPLTHNTGMPTLPGTRVITIRTSDNSVMPISVDRTGDWFNAVLNSPSTPATLTITVRPNSYAVGTYLGEVRVTAAAFNSPVTIPVRMDVVASLSRSIAQIANGDEYITAITLVNADTEDAPYDVRLRGSDATALPVGLTPGSHPLSGSIPRDGTRTIVTSGVGVTVAGWAEVTSPRRIGGIAVYRQRVLNRNDQEAAVPIVERPMRRFLLPFDNVGSFSTTMAAANTSSTAAASLTATVRDENGSELQRITLDALMPGGHTAFELRNVLPGTRDRRGVVEFTSTQDLSVIGLRFDNAQNAFTSFDPLPLADAPAAVSAQAFPQVANGGGYQTVFTLVNLDSMEAQYSLAFRSDEGTGISIPIAANSHALVGTVPPRGSRTIRTAGEGRLVSGWAQLSSDRALGGLAVYRQSVPGRTDQEAAVPLNGAGVRRFRLPYDNVGNFSTTVAIANVSAGPGDINVVVRDENGAELDRRLLMTLPPFGHTAFELRDRILATASRRGLVEFTTSSDVSVVGLRFNTSSNSFTSFRSVQ